MTLYSGHEWPVIRFVSQEEEQEVNERGGDVNASNTNGETPLHDGVKRGDVEIVKELLDNGADAHIQPFKGNLEGKSPMKLASEQNKTDVESVMKKFTKESDMIGEEKTIENGHVTTDEALVNGITLNDSIVKELPETSPRPCSHIPKKIEVDEWFSFLCPQPQHVQQHEGLFFVPPTELTIQVVTSQDEILMLKGTLDLFVVKFQAIGISVNYEYYNNANTTPPKGAYMQCIVNRRMFTHKQEYRIQVSTHKVLVLSSDFPSMFYGVSTFLQILKLFKGKAIPLVQICDWPVCMKRSVLFDMQNNDLPKMELLYELVDMLALFKVNQIQLNVDHVIDEEGKSSLSPSEFFEFQSFCQQRYIEVVPYIIIDQFSPIVSVTVKRRMEIKEEQLTKLTNHFVFSKYLHVSVKGIDAQKIYQQLQSACVERGTMLQFTTDRSLDVHLEQAMSLMNNFLYSFNASNISTYEQDAKFAEDLGLQYAICLKNDAMYRICPDHVELVTAVQDISSRLSQVNCHCFCVNYTKTSRQIGNLSLVLPSLLISASMGWNSRKMSDTKNYIKKVVNHLIYEDDHDVIASHLLVLGETLPVHRTTECCKSLIDDAIQFYGVDAKMNENIQEFSRHLKVVRNDLEKMKLNFGLSQFVRDELLLTNGILFLISKLSYAVLHYQSKHLFSATKFSDLPEVAKSDNSNRLMVMIKEYETFLSQYYKQNAHSSFVSLELLKDLLEEILPSTATTPSSPTLLGIFTI